jgi:hypothetical protein
MRAIAAVKGSLSISEYPGDMVRLSCEICGRSGQYRKQNLIEKYGDDMRLRPISTRRIPRADCREGARLEIKLKVTFQG